MKNNGLLKQENNSEVTSSSITATALQQALPSGSELDALATTQP